MARDLPRMKRLPVLALAVLLLAGCSSAPAPDLKTASRETEKIFTEAKKTPAPSQQMNDVEPRDPGRK